MTFKELLTLEIKINEMREANIFKKKRLQETLIGTLYPGILMDEIIELQIKHSDSVRLIRAAQQSAEHNRVAP